MLDNMSYVVKKTLSASAHTCIYAYSIFQYNTRLTMLFSWDFIVIYENECVTCVTSIKE